MHTKKPLFYHADSYTHLICIRTCYVILCYVMLFIAQTAAIWRKCVLLWVQHCSVPTVHGRYGVSTSFSGNGRRERQQILKHVLTFDWCRLSLCRMRISRLATAVVRVAHSCQKLRGRILHPTISVFFPGGKN